MRSTATASRRSASPARRATGAWRASCSNAARSPNRRAHRPCCSPPRAPKKTMSPACNCCSATRRRPMRAMRAAAARCTKRRAADTWKSSKHCSTTGADAHARDIDGRTPWLDAARGGHLEVLERLLPHHPDVAIANADGRDALMLAATARERVGRARAPPARTRPGSRAPRQRRPPRRRTRRGRRTLDDRRRARPGVSLARGGRRCGRVVGADRPRTGHAAARCDPRWPPGRHAQRRRPAVVARTRCATARHADHRSGCARERRLAYRLAAVARRRCGSARRPGRQRDVRAARARPRRRFGGAGVAAPRGVAGRQRRSRALPRRLRAERSRGARARTTRDGIARTRRRCLGALARRRSAARARGAPGLVARPRAPRRAGRRSRTRAIRTA